MTTNAAQDPRPVEITTDPEFPVTIAPSRPSSTAFGRLRVADPYNLFDTKLLYDDAPLLWYFASSGGAFSQTYNATRASVTLFGPGAGGFGIRATNRKFNYEPGKSQLILMTFVMGATPTGCTKKVGLWDTINGVYFENTAGALSFNIDSFVTGATVTTSIPQASWNLDPLDGTGPSGITLDITKAQILVMDFQWLGVGSVRFGFDIDGDIVYAHQQDHANTATSVFMSNPNLPLNYAIITAGTGADSTLECICSSVVSEGGSQSFGRNIAVTNGTTAVAMANSALAYALVGIRLKSTALSQTAIIQRITAMSATANDYWLWELRWNPTVAGVFTYADVTSSQLQSAIGVAANTVTGGTVVAAGYVSREGEVSIDESIGLVLGSTVTTRDTYVLCGRPVNTPISVLGGIVWKEA